VDAEGSALLIIQHHHPIVKQGMKIPVPNRFGHRAPGAAGGRRNVAAIAFDEAGSTAVISTSAAGRTSSADPPAAD
jgi:hypothetical protein